jgi:hypothetical protein
MSHTRRSEANGELEAGLDKLADRVVALALSGDKWALEEIGNRLDGKPTPAPDEMPPCRTAA